MRCSTCGTDTYTANEDAASIVCGRCVQALCAGEVLRVEARLAQYDADEFVAWRNEHGWTQPIAAARIGVSITELRNFEHGTALCPVEIADWMDARAEKP